MPLIKILLRKTTRYNASNLKHDIHKSSSSFPPPSTFSLITPTFALVIDSSSLCHQAFLHLLRLLFLIPLLVFIHFPFSPFLHSFIFLCPVLIPTSLPLPSRPPSLPLLVLIYPFLCLSSFLSPSIVLPSCLPPPLPLLCLLDAEFPSCSFLFSRKHTRRR